MILMYLEPLDFFRIGFTCKKLWRARFDCLNDHVTCWLYGGDRSVFLAIGSSVPRLWEQADLVGEFLVPRMSRYVALYYSHQTFYRLRTIWHEMFIKQAAKIARKAEEAGGFAELRRQDDFDRWDDKMIIDKDNTLSMISYFSGWPTTPETADEVESWVTLCADGMTQRAVGALHLSVFNWLNKDVLAAYNAFCTVKPTSGLPCATSWDVDNKSMCVMQCCLTDPVGGGAANALQMATFMAWVVYAAGVYRV